MIIDTNGYGKKKKKQTIMKYQEAPFGLSLPTKIDKIGMKQ